LKPLRIYILFLLILNLISFGTGYLLISAAGVKFALTDITILTFIFSLISFITITIFLRGQTKEPDSQTLHSLVSVSFKFLLEMVLALVWFIVAKKISLTSVIIFFVLYLTFTLFSIWVILKTLRNKSL
jgi:hypothetical protein